MSGTPELKKKAHPILTIFGFFVFFALGFGASKWVVVLENSLRENAPQLPYSVRQQGYTYINPLLECESADGRLNEALIPFRKEIEEVVNKSIAEGRIQNAAVYFRDLNNGPTFGINEQDEYLPASLLKLPLMLNFFKLAETRPEILKEKILFKEPYPLTNLVQTYRPSKELVQGNTYTIEELIEHAIIYSDNQATELLLHEAVAQLKANGQLDNAPIGVESDLRYISSILGEDPDKLSVKNYSTFFRILYNASYLGREYSEKALTLLASSEFQAGLVSGLPKNISVAHKFGEAGSTLVSAQLHDCGIVYIPNKPYLLCVMTKGKDPMLLPAVIRDISAETYKHVMKQR